jgi:hypothetical protein
VVYPPFSALLSLTEKLGVSAALVQLEGDFLPFFCAAFLGDDYSEDVIFFLAPGSTRKVYLQKALPSDLALVGFFPGEEGG